LEEQQRIQQRQSSQSGQWSGSRQRDNSDWQRRQQSLQQQRASQYRERWQQQQRFFQLRERELQQQRRLQRLRFEQRYWEQRRLDQLRLQNFRYNDYGTPSYRYYRQGNYYETNQYGADLLRRAVNHGYEEGFRAGQADRQDGWGYNPQESGAYQDASYGYDGYYVDVSEYQYYFQQGFERGYEDGYYSRSQYGTSSGGRYNILAQILGAILSFQSY